MTRQIYPNETKNDGSQITMPATKGEPYIGSNWFVAWRSFNMNNEDLKRMSADIESLDNISSNGNFDRNNFSHKIRVQEIRKLRVLRKTEQRIWFGFGMSGLIGWSVAIPAALGALLGLWIDNRYPGNHSWTFAMLTAGLVFGSWNAWHWVVKENKTMKEKQEEKDE